MSYIKNLKEEVKSRKEMFIILAVAIFIMFFFNKDVAYLLLAMLLMGIPALGVKD